MSVAKITINNSAPVIYPRVGVFYDAGNKCVTLFIAPKKGLVIESESKSMPVGYYSSAWEEEVFKFVDCTVEFKA